MKRLAISKGKIGGESRETELQFHLRSKKIETKIETTSNLRLNLLPGIKKREQVKDVLGR